MCTNLNKQAHWLLRIALASVFLYHGIGKFPHLSQLAEMMKMPVALIFLLATMETFGALFVLLGGFWKEWATRLGALLLMPPMLGAIALVHWPQWNFVATKSHPMGGMEFQVTLLLIEIYLLIKGNSA